MFIRRLGSHVTVVMTVAEAAHLEAALDFPWLKANESPEVGAARQFGREMRTGLRQKLGWIRLRNWEDGILP